MKKLKNLSVLMLMVMLAIVATGCAEGGNETNPKQSQESNLSEQEDKTDDENTKPKINVDLLDDFGMTLNELEKKYGEPVRGKYDLDGELHPYENCTYFFKNNDIGYTFLYPDKAEENLPDGTVRIKPENMFNYFKGRVGDLFLGVEGSITVEEFNNTYGVSGVFEEKIKSLLSSRPDDWELPDWSSGFWHSNGRVIFVIYVDYEQDGTIKSDSVMQFVYQMQSEDWANFPEPNE